MAEVANVHKLSQQPAALFDEVVVIAGRHTRLHLYPDTGNRYRSENNAFLNPSQSRRAPLTTYPFASRENGCYCVLHHTLSVTAVTKGYVEMDSGRCRLVT